MPEVFEQARRRLADWDLRDHEEKILLLLALVVSAVVGLVVVAFVAATEKMGHLLLTAGSASRVLSPFAGSMLGGWLLYRFFPDARGSGIPQTRVALLLEKGVIHIRTVMGKFVCSSISLASGVALGREGPSVQIGAGIASFTGRRLGLSEEQVRSLIPVGTAAAVAAAFNTPLAAVLFTLEEILADLHARVVGSVVIGAATSWMILRLILGDEPLFHVPPYQLVHPVEFLVYALLGLSGGVVSTGFVRLLLWQRRQFQRTPASWRPFTPAIGGLATGLLALAAPGVLGVGYNLVSEALNGQVVLRTMCVLLVLKLLATSLCYASGNAGGIFGPSLFIGAMLGGSVGWVAHLLLPAHTGNAGAYALVGMGAAFAGIIRTPMTSVIMIFEITRDYSIIVPLMIANLCSYALAQRLQRVPIYEALARQDGITMPSPSHLPEPLRVEDAPGTVPLEAAPRDGLPTVYPDDSLDLALQRMGARGVEAVVVLRRAGNEPERILTRELLLAAYRKPAARRLAPSARNWLPVLAVLTVTAVMILSVLVFWQRNRWQEQGREAYQSGQKLLAQGQVEEAVLAFRNALAVAPRDRAIRSALGLALVQSGHFAEAGKLLGEAIEEGVADGPVFVGMGRVALSKGEKERALGMLERGLNSPWPSGQQQARLRSQLDFATLLVEEGRKGEAVSLLQTMIEQSGSHQWVGKLAAEQIARTGDAPAAEEAFRALSRLFPADAEAWIKLGDARFAQDKDVAALEAYRHAAAVDSANMEAAAASARLDAILHLDPTRRGLSIRERARRWDDILERALRSLSGCLSAQDLTKAAALLRQRSIRVDLLDRKMEATVALWRTAGQGCQNDPVLAHIFGKLRD